VDYPELSRERKLAILLQWEQDALHLSTSASEVWWVAKKTCLASGARTTDGT
jgi:hypothetical protein